MKKLINRYTNTEMWVADERVEKYLKAGHKPAETPPKPTKRKKTGGK